MKIATIKDSGNISRRIAMNRYKYYIKRIIFKNKKLFPFAQRISNNDKKGKVKITNRGCARLIKDVRNC